MTRPPRKRILVPIDGSATAEQGLREAIRLAADQKARLRLLYVIDDFPMLVELSSVANFDEALQKLRDYGQRPLAGAQKMAGETGVQPTRFCAKSRKAASPTPRWTRPGLTHAT